MDAEGRFFPSPQEPHHLYSTSEGANIHLLAPAVHGTCHVHNLLHSFAETLDVLRLIFLAVSGTEKTNYAILPALKQELSSLVGVQISLGCVLSCLQEISHRHLSISLMLIMKPGFSFLFGDLLPGTVPWIGETRFCLALPPPLLPQLI